MRAGIEVSNRHEADAVARAVEDPVTKAAIVVSGVLLELPTIAQRRAVISVVATLIGFNGNGKPAEITQLRLHDGGASGE